jgi:hypothetical protein
MTNFNRPARNKEARAVKSSFVRGFYTSKECISTLTFLGFGCGKLGDYIDFRQNIVK